MIELLTDQVEQIERTLREARRRLDLWLRATEPRPDGWYVMHDHGTDKRHIHHVIQSHRGDVNNILANDHAAVEVVDSLEEARARSGASATKTTEDQT